jgi:hypothetical protein
MVQQDWWRCHRRPLRHHPLHRLLRPPHLERRHAITRARTLDSGIKNVISGTATPLDDANDGKLIHLTGDTAARGPATTRGSQTNRNRGPSDSYLTQLSNNPHIRYE